jgi:hypothetical protein
MAAAAAAFGSQHGLFSGQGVGDRRRYERGNILAAFDDWRIWGISRRASHGQGVNGDQAGGTSAAHGRAYIPSAVHLDGMGIGQGHWVEGPSAITMGMLAY